jgi:hypothetical protein
MNDKEITQYVDDYESFLEECRAIVVESVFTSRFALVEGYWLLGKRIREEVKLKKYLHNEKGRIMQGLAKDLKVSTRTLHYSLQAYDKYPDLSTLPEGKNISWNKLITKYLPNKILDTEEKLDDSLVIMPQPLRCPNCGFDLSKLPIDKHVSEVVI